MNTNGRSSRNLAAFTPQPTKRSNLKPRRSVSSLNLENNEGTQDALFDTLMGDPAKRTMILKLLAQERENIERYKQKVDKRKITKLKRTERLLHCESPTALLRRRVLEKKGRDSDASSTTSDSKSATSTPSQTLFDNLLRGVVAYVEIRSKEGNRSAGAKALMRAMGATIRDHFSTDVTHVIFRDGSFTTYQKAKLKKVHLVSVLWLEAVRRTNSRVPEKNYPALGTEAFDVNISQICMDYEEVVNQEKRRSQAMGLLNPFSKAARSRKTALPTELQPIQYGENATTPRTGGRISEFVIPTSQDWEAASVISCASGTLPYRRTFPTLPEEDSDRLQHSTPELTSDDDSDCGVIDGQSSKRDSSSLDLSHFQHIDNEQQSLGENEANISKRNTRASSLLSLKSAQGRKSSYQLVDMDLTNSIGKENLNLESGTSAKRAKKDSSVLSDDSINFLDEIPGLNLKKAGNKNDPGSSTSKARGSILLPTDEKLYQESYVDLSSSDISIADTSGIKPSRTTNDLLTKYKKKCSTSSDATLSLRFSTSSKKNNLSLTRSSDKIQRNRVVVPSNSEEMPSLRISLSSNEVLSKENGQLPGKMNQIQSFLNDVSGMLNQKNKKRNSLNSEDVPFLGIPDNAVERRKTRSSTRHGNNLVDEKNQGQDGLPVNNESEMEDREGSALKKLSSKDDCTPLNRTRSSKSRTSIESSVKTSGKKRKSTSKENDDNQTRARKSAKLSDPLSTPDVPPLTISDVVNLNRAKDQNIGGDSTENVPSSTKEPMPTELEGEAANLEETNRVETQGDIDNSAQSISNCDRSTSKRTEGKRNSKRSSTGTIQSKGSFMPNQSTPFKENVNTNVAANLITPKSFIDNRKCATNVKTKKYRKLYNLNQSADEILKHFDLAECKENKKTDSDIASTLPSTAVVVKTCTVPLIPITITPHARKLIESDKNKEIQAKAVTVAKKELAKPQKKVNLNSSKDEQKELTDEYVNKTTRQNVGANKENELESRSAQVSRRSQRLSQIKNNRHCEEDCSNEEEVCSSEEVIKPKSNRRSTFDFVQTPPARSQKKTRRKKKSSIVCTRMHKPEVQDFIQVIRKLDNFFVEDEVSDRTTHLVMGETKRTINLLRALARGCWILKHEWVFRSLEAGKWLPEEDFEVTDFSPAVQKCRIERLAFGSLYSMDIFENCGPIYISHNSTPRCSDLQELVELCRGTLTDVAYNATIVVGDWVRYKNVTCVTEMWILDSITLNKRKSFKKYLIKPTI